MAHSTPSRLRIPALVLIGLAVWIILVVVWALLMLVLVGDTIGLRQLSELIFDLDSEIWLTIHLPAAVIVLVQYALFIPIMRPVTLAGRPRRPWYAAVAAALLGALLIGGVFCIVFELPQLPYALGLVEEKPVFGGQGLNEVLVQAPLIIAVIMLCTWAFWTFVLLRVMRRGRGDWLSRSLRWLIAGTLVELAIALPLYLVVRRRFDCWCALPSFWSLVFSIGALLSLTGPGVILLWRRRAGLPTDAWVNRCMICGYQRLEDSGPRCPECGNRWGRLTDAGQPATTSDDGRMMDD